MTDNLTTPNLMRKLSTGKISTPEKTLSRGTSKNNITTETSPRSKDRGKTFNLQQYDFEFSSIFEYDEIFTALYDFLCNELKTKNYRQLDFLNQLHLLSAQENFLEKEKLATEMVKKFISRGGEQELYVSSNQKQLAIYEFDVVCTKLKNLQGDTLRADAFEQCFEAIRSTLMIELNRDVAPRFLRSKECRNVLMYFADNAKVLVLKQVKEFPYTNEDFQNQIVLEKDQNFMRNLARDDLTWEVIESNPGELNIYFSEHIVLPDQTLVKDLNLYKFELTLPYSLERCIASIIPTFHMKTYSPNLVKFKELEHYSQLDLHKMFPSIKNLPSKSNVVGLMDIQLPFPATTLRKYPFVSSIQYNKGKQEVLIVLKPVYHKSLGKQVDKFEWAKKTEFHSEANGVQKKEPVYFMFDFQGWLFRSVDENTTIYTQIHIGDLGGWASNASIMRLVVKKRGIALRANLIKHIESLPKDLSLDNSVDLLKMDPFGKMLVEEM